MAEYINREELLKDIDDSVRFSTRNGVSAELRGAHKIVDCIHSAPSADVVEVVHGRWKIKTDDYDCEYMMCSCCKEEFYPVDADTVDTTPNYCPNCGAKMDGDKK